MRNLQVSHSLNRGISKHRANVFLSRCSSSSRCRTLTSSLLIVESLKCLCDLWHLSDLRRALRTLFSFETFSIFCINRILSGVGWLVKCSGALFLLRNKLKTESSPPREDTNANWWGPSFTPQFIGDRSLWLSLLGIPHVQSHFNPSMISYFSFSRWLHRFSGIEQNNESNCSPPARFGVDE